MQTLNLILGEAGFVEVPKREFDPKLDSESRRPGTNFTLVHEERDQQKPRGPRGGDPPASGYASSPNLARTPPEQKHSHR